MGGTDEKQKKTLLETLLRLSARFLLSLKERTEKVERRGRRDMIRVNVSHLTCNKAEQITCSLPLTVLSPSSRCP